MFTSWGVCRVNLSAQVYSSSKKAKLFTVPLETKWISLSSAISECGMVYVPLPPPFWGQVWYSFQSVLHCKKNRAWLPTFCLITGCNFLYLLIGAYHWQLPHSFPRCCYFYLLLSVEYEGTNLSYNIPERKQCNGIGKCQTEWRKTYYEFKDCQNEQQK